MTVAEDEDEWVSVTPQGKLRFSAAAAKSYLPEPIRAVSVDVDHTSTGEMGLRPEYEQWPENHNVHRQTDSAMATVSMQGPLSIAGVESLPESGVRCPIERHDDEENVILIDVADLVETDDE